MRKGWQVGWVAVALGFGFGCAGNHAQMRAQPVAQVQQGPQRSVHGLVQSYTHSPDGRVDGFVISDGTRIHTAPDVSSRIQSVAQIGMDVNVTGHEMRQPDGTWAVEAAWLLNGSTSDSLDIDALHRPPPPPAYGGSGPVQPGDLTPAPQGVDPQPVQPMEPEGFPNRQP